MTDKETSARLMADCEKLAVVLGQVVSCYKRLRTMEPPHDFHAYASDPGNGLVYTLARGHDSRYDALTDLRAQLLTKAGRRLSELDGERQAIERAILEADEYEPVLGEAQNASVSALMDEIKALGKRQEVDDMFRQADRAARADLRKAFGW